MSGVPASSRSFNGGTVTQATTFTAPVTVDLSADVASRRALHVILPTAFDFSVEAFTFEVKNQFGLLSFTTSGDVSTNGNGLRTAGGSISTTGGQVAVQNVASVNQHVLASSQVGFFAALPTSQPTGVAVTAAAIHAALVALGLITA